MTRCKENTMSMNLFASASSDTSWKEELSPGAVVRRGFASTDEAVLLAALNGVIALAPFRQEHLLATSSEMQRLWH